MLAADKQTVLLIAFSNNRINEIFEQLGRVNAIKVEKQAEN